jgi:hypothetical protein
VLLLLTSVHVVAILLLILRVGPALVSEFGLKGDDLSVLTQLVLAGQLAWVGFGTNLVVAAVAYWKRSWALIAFLVAIVFGHLALTCMGLFIVSVRIIELMSSGSA